MRKEKTDRDPDLQVSGHGHRDLSVTSQLTTPVIVSTPFNFHPPPEQPIG
jgi:hypothetical protein